jgi:hypothetical protein
MAAGSRDEHREDLAAHGGFYPAEKPVSTYAIILDRSRVSDPPRWPAGVPIPRQHWDGRVMIWTEDDAGRVGAIVVALPGPLADEACDLATKIARALDLHSVEWC